MGALYLERRHPLVDEIGCRGLIAKPISLTGQGTFVTSVMRDTPLSVLRLRRYQLSNPAGRQYYKFSCKCFRAERFVYAEGSGGVSRLGT
jgi:hypothetical protein